LGASIAAGVIVADAFGSLLFTEGAKVRKIGPDGILSTVAGNGTQGFSGDGGPATDAEVHIPSGLAFDRNQNLLIADPWTNRIRLVSADGIISTIAGNGGSSSFRNGDGGPATSATVGFPTGLAADASGNIFIADNSGLRRISANGIISTLGVNTNAPQSSGD